MNTKNITLLAFFLILSANTVYGATNCNKNSVCEWQKGERAISCSDCYKTIYPEIKFIKADITAYSGKIVNMNDFGEASIKFSVKAINGNVYISANQTICDATSTQDVNVLLAETSYSPKAKIYFVPKNKIVEFECRILMMPEETLPFIARMKQIAWGKTARTAGKNILNEDNYPEIRNFSTFPMTLKTSEIKMIIPGLHVVALKQRADEWKKQLDVELKNASKKKANSLKLQIEYINKVIEKFSIKED